MLLHSSKPWSAPSAWTPSSHARSSANPTAFQFGTSRIWIATIVICKHREDLSQLGVQSVGRLQSARWNGSIWQLFLVSMLMSTWMWSSCPGRRKDTHGASSEVESHGANCVPEQTAPGDHQANKEIDRRQPLMSWGGFRRGRAGRFGTLRTDIPRSRS